MDFPRFDSMKMKFLFAIVLLVSAVAAQQANDGRALAEILEKRGDALIERTKKTLEEIRQSGHWHLAGSLDHQLVIVEALVLDLKTQLSDATKQMSVHHLNVIEEDLLHYENSIMDELAIINQVRTQPQPQPETATQLVAKADNLIKLAQESLLHHRNTPEASGIEREVAAIQALIKAINAKPSAADLKNDAEQLDRHEKSLQVLLEKAANRGTAPVVHPPIVHHGF